MAVSRDTLTRSQAARRGRVIEAAMWLAANGGYEAVQMRDVATRAEVALGTIYRYFTSKDHLLAASLVEWSRDLERRLTAKPPRSDTTADRVVDVLGRATRSMQRSRSLTAALITAVTSSDPAVGECQRELTSVMSGMMLEAMEGLDDEDLKQDVSRVLSHVWFAALVGWVHGWEQRGEITDEVAVAARRMLGTA